MEISTTIWRFNSIRRGERVGGSAGMADSMRSEPERYTWRQGKFEISVSREGDQWHVQSTSSGRLFGPRQVLYDARHRMAKHAAWDVMACVIRTTSDEDEGVRVGRSAARWMRDGGLSA